MGKAFDLSVISRAQNDHIRNRCIKPGCHKRELEPVASIQAELVISHIPGLVKMALYRIRFGGFFYGKYMGNINIIIGADRYVRIHRQNQENEKGETKGKQPSGRHEEYIVQLY
jgi:hypothetical protein